MDITLKEKFNVLVPKEFGGMQEPLLSDCEKVADDYAIEFAYWCEWGNTKRAIHTYEELLQIFKKEKAL